MRHNVDVWLRDKREEGDERNDLYVHGLVQPPKLLLLEHDSNPCALLP